MKIAIDIEHIKNKKTGVGYYTYNLIKHLLEIDPNNQYLLFYWNFSDDNFKPFGDLKKNFIYKRIKSPFKFYFKLFKLGINIPLNFFIKKVDILFFPNFVIFPSKKTKTVVVIYDLSYIKYPQFSDAKNVAYLSKFVAKTVKKADQIITISESSKNEISKYYNFDKTKISIVSPAIDKKIFFKRNEQEIKGVKEKYKIRNNYFLFTSTLEPRKNVERIVRAYCNLPKEIKKDFSLVLAGGKGWQDEGIEKTITEARKEGEKLITTGYVPEEDLPALYSGASLFLYPSIYEGFGIPILEAIACEVPVITANNSSMPEVGGEAAMYVEATDIEDIKNKVIKVVSDNNLRLEMIEKGKKQIEKFNWYNSAEKLIELFKEINEY